MTVIAVIVELTIIVQLGDRMQVTQKKPRRGHLRLADAPAECPQVIEDLISACLRQSPADRPSAKEVCHTLAQAMQTEANALGMGHSSSPEANGV